LLQMQEVSYRKLFRQRVVTLTFWATAGLLLSFVIMGYIPLFAANPLAAKYAHDEYRAGYLRAAAILNPSFFILVSVLPLFIVICVERKRLRYYFCLVLGIAATVALLRRGAIGIPLVVGSGILVAARRSRITFALYLTTIICAVWIGALANYLLYAYLSINVGHFDPGEDVGQLIAAGRPEVSEDLLFFESFERQQTPFTLGAQFVGGLIPAQSLVMSWIPLARYNSSFWAMGVLYGTNDQEFIRNIAGAGPNVPVPISGYCAFGWIGAAVMSILTGFIVGYLTRFAKTYAGQGSVEQSAIVVVMYVALFEFVGNPCNMTLSPLMPVILLAWLLYPVKIRFLPQEWNRIYPASIPT